MVINNHVRISRTIPLIISFFLLFIVQTTSALSIIGWGSNVYDQAAPPGGNDFVTITAGSNHSLALRSDGSIIGWGNNFDSQAKPPGGYDYVMIAAGGTHSLALKSDGSIVGWGANWSGQTDPPEGNDFISIDTGEFHSLALKADGTIVCWGYDYYGQTRSPAGNGFVAIAAGSDHSLALKADGSIVGWGRNYNWNGTTWIGQATPPAGNDFVAIAAGRDHSLALKADGSIVAWGKNDDGQENPPEGNDFIAIAAGHYHSLALKANGSIVGWGVNSNNQATPPEGNNFVAIAACGYHSLALRKVNIEYSGGSGTSDDPFQIAKAEDLILLGENPGDYDKHFILTADIDLNPDLPGGKVFDRAMIAPDSDNMPQGYQGPLFSGVFDGNSYSILNLRIIGHSYLGLFGRIGPEAKISNVNLKNIFIEGTYDYIGGITGYNDGNITESYIEGNIKGRNSIGGLVGINCGSINLSHSTSTVIGSQKVGGLLGLNDEDGIVATSYSTGTVIGDNTLGGLVGYNNGSISKSFSHSTVRGENYYIGGLVGSNLNNISTSYSAGKVTGDSGVGGLVGWNYGYITKSYSIGMTRGTDRVGGLVSWNTGTGRVDRSLWDTETSTQQNSNGGIGRKTDAMQTINTFLDQGWDFVGETVNGREDIWLMPYGGGYPILSVIPIGEQILSSTDEIYEIATAADLITLGQRPEDYDKHIILTADIDLDPNLPGRKVFDKAVIAPDTNQGSEQFEGTPFTGIFDGNGHVIRNLHIEGHRHLGLFGNLGIGAIVSNLGVEAVEVSEGSCIGGLAGSNSGSIIASYTTGVVTGTGIWVGGLAGFNNGQIKMSYSTAVVTEYSGVGGLVGCNVGIISSCYSSGPVNGHDVVGGLVGYNADPGRIENSYSSSRVSGIAWNWKASFWIGGLIGNNFFGTISTSYSVGPVSGDGGVGGFVGKTTFGSINDCFWDKVTTNQTEGIGDFEFTNNNLSGRTTTEMMRQDTFIIKGWDFVDESENGTDDFWKIWDNYDYPRLIWEPGPNTPLVFVDINDLGFYGQMSKYEVTNAQYCDFLNAALASGDITVNGTDVEGAGGSNGGTDYAGQLYYNSDGSGYTGYGATNGGASRIHYNAGAFNVDTDFGNHPVTYVSWYGVMAFANYYGYYLPTEDQWQAVADYDGTYIYGCGQIIDPGIANYRPSEHPDGTTPVGSFGIYGYGMSDMAGNVWEWTSSSLDSNRIFRGGSMGSIDSDCDVSIRGDGIPYAAYYDIGFRVCR